MKQWRAFIKRHLSIQLFKHLKYILNNHIFCFYLSKWWWESIWDNFLRLLLNNFTFAHLLNSQLTWSVRDAVNMLMILNCVVVMMMIIIFRRDEMRWVAMWCDAMSVVWSEEIDGYMERAIATFVYAGCELWLRRVSR